MVVGEIATTVMMAGPAGVLVPLGIEYFCDSTTTTMMYNYIAAILLVLIAATAGSRSEPSYCIVIPIFAGMFTLFGWLTFSNKANAIAMMVIAGFLGVGIYMNEVNRERNGVGGPGSKFLNIVFFLILFQVILGIMPTLGLFDPDAASTVAYGNNYCPPGATCDAYSNVEIQQTAYNIGDTGGLLSGAASIITGLTTAFIAMFGFLITACINVLTSATVITTLIGGIWPGLTSNAIYLAFWGMISVVFWACDLIFVMNAVLKLFPSEGSI